MSATEQKQPGAGFQALLGELDTMTKAIPAAGVADDKKIQAAAGVDDDKNKEGEGEEGIGGAAPLAKSMQVTLADGTVIEAEDGTELVKSLFARVDGQEDLMVKALGGAINLIKVQGEQLAATNALVKSLQIDLAKLGNQGAGRKTMVSVHEQVSEMTKSMQQQPQGPTPQEFLAKANTAFSAGKITGHEFTVIDVSLRQQEAIDPALFAKVNS